MQPWQLAAIQAALPACLPQVHLATGALLEEQKLFLHDSSPCHTICGPQNLAEGVVGVFFSFKVGSWFFLFG